jgi:hypothetical protein
MKDYIPSKSIAAKNPGKHPADINYYLFFDCKHKILNYFGERLVKNDLSILNLAIKNKEYE